MVDLSNEFETFYNNHVVLSRKDQNELRKKKNTNIKRLKSGLIEYNKENYTSYSVADTLVQGSMAMYTVVQNDNKDYDIDVAIIFDKDNLGNDIGAIKAKNIVCEALKKKCTQLKNDPEVKKNCVTVSYTDGYHIDFAVYRRYKKYSWDEEYTYEHAGPQQWEERNPKAINEWFSDEIDNKGIVLRKVIMVVYALKEKLKIRDSSSTLPDLDDMAFLRDLKLIVEENGQIRLTIAGLLFVGKEQSIQRLLPQAEVIYLHYGKDNLEEYNARLDMKQPIITILDRLTEKIQNENKIENVQIGLFRLEVADFSEKVFQEALLNALSHRDYQQMGAVYVKHYPDKIVIENPGGFLDGITADNIITHPSAPRNKLIAETLQSLKYVQRTGQGVDIIYKEMVSMGKPYPVYRVFSDSVQLTIESAMEDPDFVRFIVKEQDSKQINLSLSQLMILRYIVENRKIKFADVQKVAQISAEEARKCCAELMKFGLIEITGKEYMLTARVYEAVKSDIEYTRDKTVQYIKAKDMITEYIKLQGYINRSTVQELCGFTDQQARRTIEKMKEENIIEMSNGGRYAKYILKEI